MDSTHEAGRLLATWMSGKKEEVVKQLRDKNIPATKTLLMATYLASTLPDDEIEELLRMLEREHQEYLSQDC